MLVAQASKKYQIQELTGCVCSFPALQTPCNLFLCGYHGKMYRTALLNARSIAMLPRTDQLNSTRITESPLRNLNASVSIILTDRRHLETAHILLMNLSLLTGLPFFPPVILGVSVHISFTFSSTILQCLSNAFTLASSFRLLRHEIST